MAARAIYAAKLPNLIKKHDSVLPNIRTGIEQMLDLAKTLEAALIHKDPAALANSSVVSLDQDLVSLDQLVRDMCDLDNSVHTDQRTLQRLQQKLEAGHLEDGKILEWFDASTTDAQKLYDSQTAEEKYNENDYYADFRQEIWAIRHPQSRFKFECLDDDEDIQMLSETRDYKCPITQEIMVDPWKSDICKHVFSEAIVRLVQSQQKLKCPMSGCSAVIEIQNLAKDARLKREIAIWINANEDEDM